MTKRASEKLYENTGKLFTTRSFKSLIAVLKLYWCGSTWFSIYMPRHLNCAIFKLYDEVFSLSLDRMGSNV